jgi:hypothetical protein
MKLKSIMVLGFYDIHNFLANAPVIQMAKKLIIGWEWIWKRRKGLIDNFAKLLIFLASQY